MPESTIWEGHLLPKGEFLYVDPSGNRQLNLTTEFLQSAIDNTKFANAHGKRTIATDGHPKPDKVNDKTLGYGIDYFLGDDAGLYAKVDMRNPVFSKRLKDKEIEEVSPVISMEPFTLPDGTKINAPWIPQIGFTSEPRFGLQKKIRQLINSCGLKQTPEPNTIESVEGGLVFHNPCNFTLSDNNIQTGGDLMSKDAKDKVEDKVEDKKAIEFSNPANVKTDPTPDPKLALLEETVAGQATELANMRKIEFTRQATELAGKKISPADVGLYVELCEHLHTNTTLTFSAPAVDGQEVKFSAIDAFRHLIGNAPEQVVTPGTIQRRKKFTDDPEGRIKFIFSNPGIFEDGATSFTMERAKEIHETLGAEYITAEMKGGK